MEIIVNDDKKRVELWLTKSEKDSDYVCELLEAVFVKYKNMRYLVTVFESGNKDLFVNTRDLLLSNR